MSAHPLEVIALGNKVGLGGGLVYEGGDVSGNNMKAGADKTQQGGIGTAMGDNAVGATGQGFDWTKPARTGSEVDGSTPLPVLLVVHPECNGVGI
jgi:hypothetical protein